MLWALLGGSVVAVVAAAMLGRSLGYKAGWEKRGEHERQQVEDRGIRDNVLAEMESAARMDPSFVLHAEPGSQVWRHLQELVREGSVERVPGGFRPRM